MRGYDILLYVPEKDSGEKPMTVTLYNNKWHELLHDRQLGQPYLGQEREDLYQYDEPIEQAEEQPKNNSEAKSGSETGSETESDSEKSNTNLQICNSPITRDNCIFGTTSEISPTTYAADRLFPRALGDTKDSSPTTTTQEQPPSYAMATNTSTLTTTATHAALCQPTSSSGTEEGTGSGTGNSSPMRGGTPCTPQQQIHNALAATL
jgi:hypothetical protein